MQNDFNNALGYPQQYPMNYQQPHPQQHAYPVSPPEQMMYDFEPSTSSHLTATRRSHGTRRSPETLISLDAPTQSRRFPSSSGRRDYPAYNRRGSFSRPSDDEEDELTEELPLNDGSEEAEKARKRRQNTLAARRSRRRKMLHQQALEDAVEQLTREKEVWRTRALTLRQLLLSHGILCPDFKD